MNRKINQVPQIYASLMCADFGNLEQEIRLLEDAGIHGLHVDMMDGWYVQNFGMGFQDIQYTCRNASVPIELHAMIQQPERHIEKFSQFGFETVYFHPDASVHSANTVQNIQATGAKAGIVLSPETNIETVFPLLHIVDSILVMTVHPGFSGNTYLPFVEEKIQRLCKLKRSFSYSISVDGAVTDDVIFRLGEMGVDSFVLGTMGLFKPGVPYKNTLESIYKREAAKIE